MIERIDDARCLHGFRGCASTPFGGSVDSEFSCLPGRPGLHAACAMTVWPAGKQKTRSDTLQRLDILENESMVIIP